MQTHSTEPRPLLAVSMAGLAFGIAAAVAGLLRLHDAAPSLSWGWLALSAGMIGLCGREAGCLLFSRAVPRLGRFSPHARIAIVLGAIGAGAFLLAVIPVTSLTRGKHEALLRVCGTTCLGSVLLALTMWLVTRPSRRPWPAAAVGHGWPTRCPRRSSGVTICGSFGPH